jgi:hypothetical protein
MRRGDRSAERKESRMATQEGTEGGMVCSKCGQSFQTQDELDRHMRETHPEEGGMGEEGTGGTGGGDMPPTS